MAEINDVTKYMKAVKRNGMLIGDIPEDVIREHPEIALEAVRENIFSLPYVPDDVMEDMIREHPEIALEAVRENGAILEFVPGDVQSKYPEIALKAVQENGAALEFVPGDVQSEHPEIALEMVKHRRLSRNALENISENAIRKNPEIALELAKKAEFEYIPKDVMREHPNVALEAAKESFFALPCIPEDAMHEHPDIALEAVKRWGWLLHVTEAQIRKTPEMEQYREMLKEIVMVAVQKDGFAIRFIPEDMMREHPEIAIEAVKETGSALKFVPEDVMHEHTEIVAEAVRQNEAAVAYVPADMKHENLEDVYAAATKYGFAILMTDSGVAFVSYDEDASKELDDIQTKKKGGFLHTVKNTVSKIVGRQELPPVHMSEREPYNFNRTHTGADSKWEDVWKDINTGTGNNKEQQVPKIDVNAYLAKPAHGKSQTENTKVKNQPAVGDGR